MTLPGLWVDDDEQFLEDNIPRLERRGGLRIDRTRSAAEALRLLAQNPHGYAYLVVDLDMPEEDGVELIRQVRAIQLRIPVRLASAHTGEPLWVAKLETLGEEVESLAEKPFPMATSPKYGEIVQRLQYLGLRGVVEVVFKCPAEEFFALAEAQREHLTQIAARINRPYVQTYFQTHPEADWAVIACDPGSILASGSIEQEPDGEELTALSYRHGFPAFAYLRRDLDAAVVASETINRHTETASSGELMVHSALEGAVMTPTETEIRTLYSQIRELVVRSSGEPELRGEIDRKIQRLRALQEAEADELERRFEERLRLKPGSGWALLQRIKERLGDA